MQVELNGFIVFGHYDHEARWGEKPYFKFSDYEPGEGFVVVRAETITVEVPDDFDPRPKMVEKLEAEKKKAEADFHARITQINAQIQSLLAIEA
jgi:hypothetical protein